MKILSIFHIQRRATSELFFSGGERRFFEIAKRWIKSGNEVQIVGSEFVDKLAKEFELSTKIYSYRPSFTRVISDFINVKNILEKIPIEKFDFIYCPSEIFLPVTVSVLVKARKKTPLVISVNLLEPHETSIFYFLKQPFFPVYYQRRLSFGYFFRALTSAIRVYTRNQFMKRADLIFSVSRYAKMLLKEMGVGENRIFTVGGGIDQGAIKSISPQKKVYDACFLGSIQPRKGISDLIYLWKAVTNKKKTLKLMIVGSGSEIYTNKINTMIRKFNLQDNIFMPGFVDTEKKYELLKSSRIFIFPSYAESFAQAICEAMACGLPIVAYNLPVYREWYGNDMLCAEKGNLNELINITSNLLEDESLQKIMMERGLKRSRNFTWDNIAKYEMDVITQKLF